MSDEFHGTGLGGIGKVMEPSSSVWAYCSAKWSGYRNKAVRYSMTGMMKFTRPCNKMDTQLQNADNQSVL